MAATCTTGGTAQSPKTIPSRPHIQRQGKNLVANPSLKTEAKWTFLNDAEFDGSVSRTDDGSGSVKLTTPIPKGSMVFSDFIPIQGGRRYTCGFYIKTAGGPTYVGAQVSIHKANKQYIKNVSSARGGATRDGQWEEFALPVFVPKEAAFVRVQAYKVENTKPGGQVWADDFYLGEGFGLEQPPSPTRRGFAGQHVRVDRLGNFEIKKKGVWTPFFPLCMHSDNYRDWSVYSKQGWNVNIWTGAAHQVRKAKEAVSEFNPDGMLAGFQIAQYTFPGGLYNNLDHLRSSLREVYDQGLGDNLLFYYWDNEVNHDQWQVPVDVIQTIQRVDVDSSGRRLHPIYALQGTFNIARVHAARGLVDVSGTYVGGGADATGGAGLGGYEGLLILDRLEKQVNPAAMAQFNGVNGPGDMRLRLYNSIIMGAKGMGYWRDCFGPNQKEDWSVGPVDKKPWWPDFPKLRREVDKLLPIIREPHWTTWKANTDAPGLVRVGTRDHKGEGYLILVNQTSNPTRVTVTLDGLRYTAKEVRDYCNDKTVATVGDQTFSIILPKIGVGSGTIVLRIVKP